MNKIYREAELTDELPDSLFFGRNKAQIAYELGVRDKRIAELEKEREMLCTAVRCLRQPHLDYIFELDMTVYELLEQLGEQVKE